MNQLLFSCCDQWQKLLKENNKVYLGQGIQKVRIHDGRETGKQAPGMVSGAVRWELVSREPQAENGESKYWIQ